MNSTPIGSGVPKPTEVVPKTVRPGSSSDETARRMEQFALLFASFAYKEL